MSKGPPISLADLLNHVQDTTPDNWNGFPLRPSAAGFCTRRLAFDTVNYIKPGTYPVEQNEARIKRLLSFGHAVESHLIYHLGAIKAKADDFQIKYKQQVLPLFFLKPVGDERPLLIEGSLDLAIQLNGELMFCDIKSYGEKWSNFYKTKTDETYAKYDSLSSLEKISENGWYAPDLKAFLDEVNDPFLAQNFYQLNAYCNSQFALDHGVKLGSILKYNKNDSGLYEIRFTPHAGMYEEIKEKFQTAYNAAFTGNPMAAKCDYALGSVSCAFCPYKDKCHGDDATKAFYSTFGAKKWPTDLHDRSGQVKSDYAKVADLLAKFHEAEGAAKETESLEQELVLLMTEKGLSKVRLNEHAIYELKQYKTGGVANGPRVAVKRGKL